MSRNIKYIGMDVHKEAYSTNTESHSARQTQSVLALWSMAPSWPGVMGATKRLAIKLRRAEVKWSRLSHSLRIPYLRREAPTPLRLSTIERLKTNQATTPEAGRYHFAERNDLRRCKSLRLC
jgi:hypothetical protein